MLTVVVALAALAAALTLYLAVERVGAAGLPLALLRALAWAALAALLLDPGCERRGVAVPPVVLLDQSLSMSTPGDTAGGGPRWRAALDTARALAGRRGRILLFGARPAAYRPGARPDAPATRLVPAWREAVALGGPIAIVTDGEVGDAAALPGGALATARIVVLPRPPAKDVGVAALSLPEALRAGDTATARVVLVAAHTAPGDTARLVLLQGARVVARERVAVGAGGGGSFARDLRFVPLAPPRSAGSAAEDAAGEVQRFTARVTGVRGDREPRDDARVSLALVSRASAIALFSDSPDWDFRWLAVTLKRTSGVPVRGFLRLTPRGAWLDADSLSPAGTGVARQAARDAALVVVQGTARGTAALARLARHALWTWTTGASAAAAVAGDWYVEPAAGASPVGAALAGVPPDSLPPLTSLAVEPAPAPADTAAWVGVVAQLARRGPAVPFIVGRDSAGRRVVRTLGTGLWRWASQGGIAREAYRSLVGALTDWLLAPASRGEGAGALAADSLAARSESLDRPVDELLPRPRTLHDQPGVAVAGPEEREPLRASPWPYAVALVALMLEWWARRRRGMP